MTTTADYPPVTRRAAYDPQRPVPERPAWVFVGLVVVGAVLFAAGFTTWDAVGRQSVTDQATFAAVDTVDLRDLGPTSVTLVGSDRADVLLTRTISWRGTDRPARAERVESGSLVVESPCRALDGCYADYRLDVPRTVAARALLSSGRVEARALASVSAHAVSATMTIEDVAGAVTAETSSGSLTVCRVAGEVSLRTTSGDISACGLGGSRATLETTSGTVSAGFTGPVERIDARSTSGSVHVTVPDAAYDVRTSTRSGGQRVQVRTDPAAPGKITATTTSGSIRIDS
ncbi:MAG: DUF4097 family beta strand repeat-containing protein [Dermatophilaceae bacterium]